jgi:hypothetical protein
VFPELFPCGVRFAEAPITSSIFPHAHARFLRRWKVLQATAALSVASLGLTPVVATSAPSAAPAVSAQKVEAVYLLNFGRFVSWPANDFPDARAPLIIGVLGRDPFGSFLDEVVKGESINHRPVVVRRYASVRDVRTCHILYVSESESTRLEAVFAELDDRHILTVSDITDFAYRGGIVQFLKERERIRFRINLHRAKKSSLELSAKLLRPAEVVFQGETLQYASLTTERGQAAARFPSPRESVIPQPATADLRSKRDGRMIDRS